MPEMQPRINPVVFLKGLRAARNSFITPGKLIEISRSVFGKDLTPEQARDHLTEIEANLRPVYSATLGLLARGKERAGCIEDVLSFCKKHQASWSVSDLISNREAREQYLQSLSRRFPEKSFIIEIKKNPLLFREQEYWGPLFSLDPKSAISLIDLPEPKEYIASTDPIKELLAACKRAIKDRGTAVNLLRLSARSIGLTEILPHVIGRIQNDFLFAMMLTNLARRADKSKKAYSKDAAQRFQELLSNPSIEYTFEEARNGVYGPLNNFYARHLKKWKLYKTDQRKYESLLQDESRFYREDERDAKSDRIHQVERNICPDMDEIVHIYGLDFEIGKLPEVFFQQFIRELIDPDKYNYYKDLLRKIVIITEILQLRYGYSHRDIAA